MNPNWWDCLLPDSIVSGALIRDHHGPAFWLRHWCLPLGRQKSARSSFAVDEPRQMGFRLVTGLVTVGVSICGLSGLGGDFPGAGGWQSPLPPGSGGLRRCGGRRNHRAPARRAFRQAGTFMCQRMCRCVPGETGRDDNDVEAVTTPLPQTAMVAFTAGASSLVEDVHGARRETRKGWRATDEQGVLHHDEGGVVVELTAVENAGALDSILADDHVPSAASRRVDRRQSGVIEPGARGASYHGPDRGEGAGQPGLLPLR